MQYQADPPGTRGLPLSGVALAAYARIAISPGHFHVDAANNCERVRANLNAPVIQVGRSRKARPDDFTDREEWMESLVRQAMGRYAARRAGPVQTRTIGGRSVSAFVAAQTGAVMIDLAGWAAARSVNLNLNSAARRASFSWRGSAHLLALATDRIKVGAQWRTMPDIVIEHQDKLWVPLAILEN